MHKLLITLVLVFSWYCSFAQTRVGFETGFVRMYGDVIGGGAELELSGKHQFKNHLTFGLITTAGYNEGGNKNLNFIYGTHYVSARPSIGYVFRVNKSIAISPSLGLGIMYFDGYGRFTNESEGRNAYFMDGGKGEHVRFSTIIVMGPVPFYSFFNESVLIFSPSVQLQQQIAERLSCSYSITYNYINSDGFDAYSFSGDPEHKDYYYSLKLGLQWQLGKIENPQSTQQ